MLLNGSYEIEIFIYPSKYLWVTMPLISEQKSKLMIPNGQATNDYGRPTQLTRLNVSAAEQRFLAMRKNIEAFYAIATEGQLLAQIISLTSQKSFIDQTLQGVRQDTGFKNTLAEMLHGSHTAYSSWSVHLPWLSIFIDHLTKTPIPQNLAAIANAQASLGALGDILTSDREFYNAGLRAARVADIAGDSLQVGGLELKVFAGGEGAEMIVKPQKVSHGSATVEVGGRVFYNGLPADRQLYPTFLVPEGHKVSLRVKNTTGGLLAVMPTINGIPLRTEQINLWYGGFETTSLPVTLIKPEIKYLKPGQEADFNGFYAGRIGMCMKPKEISGNIYSERSELASLLGRVFAGSLTDDDKKLLAGANSDFAHATLAESRLAFTHGFLKELGQAKQAGIYVSKPEIADSKASSQLDNPFLGSLGVIILEVLPPPVKDVHTYSHNAIHAQGGSNKYLGVDGQTRSMGSAGLAHIGGGPDDAAERPDFLENFRHGHNIHKFIGYAPSNLMSLRK